MLLRVVRTSAHVCTLGKVRVWRNGAAQAGWAQAVMLWVSVCPGGCLSRERDRDRLRLWYLSRERDLRPYRDRSLDRDRERLRERDRDRDLAPALAMACAAESEVDAVTALVVVIMVCIAACIVAAFIPAFPRPSMPMRGSTAADTRLCVSLTLLSASSISLREQES